jgi:hypothetical protein
MKDRKGLSQVLSLIVAASVLMMTALTVTMLVTGGLGGYSTDSDVQKCTGGIRGQCSVQGGTVTPPSVCYEDGEKIEGLPNWVPSQGSTHTCGSGTTGP